MSEVPTSSSASAQDELEIWIGRTRTRLFCNAIINTEIGLLQRIFGKLGFDYLKVHDSFVSTTLATVVLAAFLYLFAIAIGKVWDSSISICNPAALYVSLLSAYSLTLVKWLHDSILRIDQNNLAKQIIAAASKSEGDLTGLLSWWKSFLSIRWQLAFVLITGALGVLFLALFGHHAPMEIHAGSYPLMFFLGIAVGQGGYCALRIPRVAWILRKTSMDLFWLNPANTQWIRKASSVFTKLSLANAFIGTCILIGFVWLRPWGSAMTMVIAGLLLLFTWIVVLYSFFYPHYQLGKIIRAERSRHLVKMQNAIDSETRTAREHGVTENEIRGMYEIIRVYAQLASAGSSAINTQAVFGLILSLGVPLISFAVLLLDIAKHLTEYVRPTPGH